VWVSSGMRIDTTIARPIARTAVTAPAGVSGSESLINSPA
jgi:hypothetical protein